MRTKVATDNGEEEDQEECDACFTPEAIALECEHNLCAACVRRLTPKHSLTLYCPYCDQISIIPEGIWMICGLCKKDVDATWQCGHCGLPLCCNCKGEHSEAHVGNLLLAVEPPPSYPAPDLIEGLLGRPQKCVQHTDHDLCFYCPICHISLCELCSHNAAHGLISLADAKQDKHQVQDRLSTKIAELRNRLQRVYRTTQQLDETSMRNNDQIRECFAKLSSLLQDRKKLLVGQLTQLTADKQHALSNERRELETVLASLEHSAKLLSTSSHQDDIVQNMVKQLESLSNYQQPDSPASSKSSDQELLMFEPTYFATMQDISKRLGTLMRKEDVPTEFRVQGEATRYCVAGKRSMISLQTRNHSGEPVYVDTLHISGEMRSHFGRVVDKLAVQELGVGHYGLAYTVLREGAYQLTVQVYGQHVGGSPYTVRCVGDYVFASSDTCSVHSRHRRSATSGTGTKSTSSRARSFILIDDDLVLKVGRHGRGKGAFTNPQDVACFSHDGMVVVTDSGAQCIQVFNQEGDCQLMFGSIGRNPGQIQRPVGVAIDQRGRIFVADYDNKWVSIFDRSGKFLSRLGQGKLLGPKGVTISQQGQVVVVDNKASCILVFEQNGRFVRKFGTRGVQPKQLAGPHFVAIDQHNRLFITDFHNHAVKVFTITGEFLFSFGSQGEGNGQFHEPTGIAIDEKQNVLVCDWGNNRVQIFDTSGSFLSYVNCANEGLYGPMGIGTAADNHLLCADSGNHCYKVFRYMT